MHLSTSDPDLLDVAEGTVHEVAQLLGRESVALDVRKEAARAIDDHRAQRMGNQALVRKVIETEHIGKASDLIGWSGEEVPPRGVRFPLAGVVVEPLGCVTRRIECDAQQHEVSAVRPLESVLQRAEMVGHPVAELRKRAARVDEVHHDDLAAELRQRDLRARLIREGKVRHCLIDIELRRRVRGPQETQAPHSQRILFPALISDDLQAFRVSLPGGRAEREVDDGPWRETAQLPFVAHLERHDHRWHDAGNGIVRDDQQPLGRLHVDHHARQCLHLGLCLPLAAQ